LAAVRNVWRFGRNSSERQIFKHSSGSQMRDRDNYGHLIDELEGVTDDTLNAVPSCTQTFSIQQQEAMT